MSTYAENPNRFDSTHKWNTQGTQLPPRLFSTVRNFGVSLATGNNATNNHGYARRISSVLDTSFSAHAAGSSKFTWHDPGLNTNCGYSRVLQNITATQKAQNTRPFAPWPVGANDLVLIKGGEADLYTTANGGDNNNARLTIPKLKHAFRTMISRARTAYIVEDEGLTFNAVGGANWLSSSNFDATPTNKCSGTRYVRTTTNGDYWEYTLPATLPPGTVIAIGGLVGNGNAHTLTVNVDGVQKATLDAGAIAPSTAGKWLGYVQRLQVDENGPIKPFTASIIRGTYTGITTAAYTDYINFESPLLTRAPVIIPGIARFYSNTLVFGSNLADRDAIFRETNTAIKEVVAEFARDGLPNPVRFVDIDAVLDKNPTYFTGSPFTNGTAADGIHWNDEGHAVVAKIIYNEILKWHRETFDYSVVMRNA